MKKTSVYLTEREERHIEDLIAVLGLSRAAIIRAAIDSYSPPNVKRQRTFALDGCYDGPGTSAADIPEEEYLKGFGE